LVVSEQWFGIGRFTHNAHVGGMMSVPLVLLDVFGILVALNAAMKRLIFGMIMDGK